MVNIIKRPIRRGNPRAGAPLEPPTILKIEAIRRWNTYVITEKAFGGVLEAFAEAIRRTDAVRNEKSLQKNYANVLSQIRGGKPMGPKLARLLEETMGVTEGWMDVLHYEVVDDMQTQAEIAGMMSKMTPAQRDEVINFSRFLLAKTAGPPLPPLLPPPTDPPSK